MTTERRDDDTRSAAQAQDVIADFGSALRFFSRLPVPRLSRTDDRDRLPDAARAGPVVPLAGAVIGLPAAGLIILLGATALPALASAVLATAVLVAVTGGLHEDGLADVADGFFGGATAERQLQIMKDSRIGTYGAVALVLALLLRVVLIAALIDRIGPVGAAVAVITGEAVSRAAMLWVWLCLPSARPGGLADACGVPTAAGTAIAVAVAVVLAVPAGFAATSGALVAGFVLAAGTSAALAELSRRKIGGYTGDVLGATQQLTSVAFLLGLAAI